MESQSSPEDVARKVVAVKRKRRSTAAAEGKNAEYHRPAKQRRGPLSPFESGDDGWNCSDTTSTTSPAVSSDCFSPNSLSSPASVGTNTLSPVGSEDVENAGEVSVDSASSSAWSARGEQTPHSRKRTKVLTRVEESPTHGAATSYAPQSEMRKCPLPEFSWASATALWRNMINKDEHDWLEREPDMLTKHPGLMPRMRAILLDWLIEVCDVHKLKRETYSLAMDYIDRYLSRNTAVSKTRLQLVGVTCLFVAAKVEEIYPPKIGEFAYVTDGACTESDILQQELLLLQSLDWNMSTVTVMGWLTIYMQVHVTDPSKLWKKTSTASARPPCTAPTSMPQVNPDAVASLLTPDKCTPTKDVAEANKTDDAFVYPQFSGMEYAHTCQLLDLCSLDMGILNYPYSVVAAAAISHVYSKKVATRVSGLEWASIEPCAKWMEPFFRVINDDTTPVFHLEQTEALPVSYGVGHFCPNANTDESYKIQTHTISLEMFDSVMRRREEEAQQQQQVTSELHITSLPDASTSIQADPCPVGLLTPPASNRKSLDVQPESDSKEDNVKT
ncbi:G1/S-specific cyclin-E isoform X1 [Lutzomyia longipalpis]|uniref:G1/S-specific cyclin-E isoform X1 n=1 Tax=Lutzomyia longipalpis TaxID=7200 RepID=UPI002484033E|nr:G1/S-specific cyclin-E isoform X1 [Lutzomyia longipalpis]XP_055683940.1 G1/S-specific cyclin-E isoform X1 [Lutzomyia longipalpis]